MSKVTVVKVGHYKPSESNNHYISTKISIPTKIRCSISPIRKTEAHLVSFHQLQSHVLLEISIVKVLY